MSMEIFSLQYDRTITRLCLNDEMLQNVTLTLIHPINLVHEQLQMSNQKYTHTNTSQPETSICQG